MAGTSGSWLAAGAPPTCWPGVAAPQQPSRRTPPGPLAMQHPACTPSCSPAPCQARTRMPGGVCPRSSISSTSMYEAGCGGCAGAPAAPPAMPVAPPAGRPAPPAAAAGSAGSPFCCGCCCAAATPPLPLLPAACGPAPLRPWRASAEVTDSGVAASPPASLPAARAWAESCCYTLNAHIQKAAERAGSTAEGVHSWRLAVQGGAGLQAQGEASLLAARQAAPRAPGVREPDGLRRISASRPLISPSSASRR